MLARSGEITEPWPVPLSSTVTIPSSRMPSLSHLRTRRIMRLSPTLCSRKRTSQSWLTDPKKFWMSASRIQFTFRLSIANRKGVQRIVWTSCRPKPVRKSTEVAFIDGVEHQDGCALDNLVFQGSYRQRPLLSVRLRYIRPAGGLRSVGSPMDPTMQVLEPKFEVCLVVL